MISGSKGQKSDIILFMRVRSYFSPHLISGNKKDDKMNNDLEFIYINLDDGNGSKDGSRGNDNTNSNNNNNNNNNNSDNSDSHDVDSNETDSDDYNDDNAASANDDLIYEEESLDTEKKKPGLRSKIVHEILSYVFIIAAAFVLAVLTNHFLIVNARIPSGSMIPTIQEGNRIIGNRLAYINSDPKRGDIVVFYYPDDESQKFIKRIIGLPGETIYITDGIVYIDGQPLDESEYLTVETYGVSGPFTIPDDCYFMLGDNRNSSNDSRFWVNHFVSRDKIIAKALFCYFPTMHLIK